MANYNLDTVEESFSVALRAKDGLSLLYNIKYPTTEEMRTIVKGSRELEDLVDNKADEKEIEQRAKQSETELNELITPSGHDIPFSEVFQYQSIRVQRQFREMIQKEFGGQ